MENNIPKHIEDTDFFKENANLVDFFKNSCNKHREKIAFESFDVGMTFDVLSVQVNSFASWLSQNFKPGDRIAVMMPNMLAYPVIVYGALMAGVIVVNINPLYTPRELEHVLRDSEAKLLLVFEGVAHVVEKSDLASVDKVVITTVGDLLGFKGKIINFVVRKVKKLVPKFNISGTQAFTEVLNEGAKMDFTGVDISINDTAFLQYTGGTTGVSKGANTNTSKYSSKHYSSFFYYRSKNV